MLSPSLLEFEHEMLRVCRSQFPKKFGTCGRIFPSFKTYIETVTPLGIPKIDTIEDEDPIGLMSFGNCPCGSTLTLLCESDSGGTHRFFNDALRQEMVATNRPLQDILIELRENIRTEGTREE